MVLRVASHCVQKLYALVAGKIKEDSLDSPMCQEILTPGQVGPPCCLTMRRTLTKDTGFHHGGKGETE